MPCKAHLKREGSTNYFQASKDQGISGKWKGFLSRSSTPIEELISPEVIAEVREHLKRKWFMTERDQYLFHLAQIWSPPQPPHPTDPAYDMLMLDSIHQKRGHRIPYINKWREHLFYNKAVVFYWLQSANNRGIFSGPVILGSIWNTWYDTLGREPQIQLDEFFAVHISVGEDYAKTILDILQAHTYLCAQFRNTIEAKRAGDKVALSKTWRDPKYFKLYPLCEALIAIFDEYKFVAARKHADGFRHYDDVAQHQSILLVRTGLEDKLSTPISFDSLKHEALPIARTEDLGSIDIVRVPLQVGIRFVTNLLLREEAAFPGSVVGGSHISKEQDHPCMKWEREALDWGENRLACAQEKDEILPFSTAATVKKAVGIHDFDAYPPEHYAPHDFRLGWV